MQSQKVARGFRTAPTPHLHLTGTMQAKIQQMKDKTRCHICRALGHWKRQCPKKDKGSGKGTKSYGKRVENMSKETHEAMVADYELQGARGSEQEELSDLDAEVLKSQFHEAFFTDDSVSELEALLAQDAQKGGASSSSQFSKVFECNFADSDAHGLESYMCDAQGAHDCSLSTHAVPDTACRKTLVGQQTLEGIESELRLRGKKVHRFEDENVFRFGNDGCLKTSESVLIPVTFKHRSVVIRAAVLPGKGANTPLLLSKEFLKQLGTQMDLSSAVVCFRKLGVEMEMGTTQRGHFAIPLFKSEEHAHTEHTEHSMSKESAEAFETQVDSTLSARHVHVHDEPAQRGHPGAPKERHGGGDDSEGQQFGSSTRSAKRRARRRRAWQRRVGDRETQREVLQQGVQGSQGVCGMGSRECGALQEEVHSRNAQVPTVCGGSRQEEEGATVTDQPDATYGTHVPGEGQARQGDSSIQAGKRVGGDYGSEPDIKSSSEPHRTLANSGGHASSDEGSPRADEAPESDHSECHQPEGRAGGSDDGDEEVHGEEAVSHGLVGVSDLSETTCMTKAEKRFVRKSFDKMLHEKKQSVDVMTVCEAAASERQHVMEVFSTPHITATAQKMSLAADYAFDIKVGCDLRTKKARDEVIELVNKTKPELLVVCPPCKMYSILQRLRKYKGEAYENALNEAREFLAFAMELCTLQHTAGRKFVFEHPWFAESWFEECVRSVAEKAGVSCVRLDQCMFNLRDVHSGLRYRKPTGIMMNCEEIRQRVEKRCNGNHEHEPVFGSVKTKFGWKRRSEMAQRYPKQLVHAILEGYVAWKQTKQTEALIATVYTAEVFSKQVDEAKVISALKRCHDNLGHPSNARLISMLKSANANETTIRLAKGLTCPMCRMKDSPPAKPVARLKKAWEFNQQIMIDTFEVEVLNRKLKLLNIVDEATAYQMVAPLWHGCTASNVRSCYRKCWKRWAGVPLRVLADNGREFDAEFLHGLEIDGSYHDTTAAYAPHQNGMTERRGQTWKRAFEKTLESVAPATRQEVDEVIDQVTCAVNTLPRVGGHSPYQHVFGKENRLPGCLELDAENDVESSALAAGESMYLKRQKIRDAARKSYIEAHEEERIKKANNHRNRPRRGPYEPGQLVYFWRMWPKDKKACWHGPGTVVGTHDGHSKIWVASGMKMYKCSPEQLRHVTHEQEAMIRLLPEDMLIMKRNVQGRGSGNYIDLSQQSFPPVDSNEETERGNNMDVDTHGIIRGAETLHDNEEERRVRPRIGANDGELDVGDDIRNLFGAVLEGQTNEPQESSGGQNTNLEQVGDNILGDHQDTLGDHQDFGQNHQRRVSFDGSVMDEEPQGEPDVNTRIPTAVTAGQTVDQVSPSEMSYGPVRTTRLTKAMRRDLDMLDSGRPSTHAQRNTASEHAHETLLSEKRRGRKEVFEHELRTCHQGSLKQAKVKEWSKMTASKAVKVLNREESDAIRGCPTLRKRIVKSRFVLTKDDEKPLSENTVIKARWCIRGYLDPDLLSLETEAPTLSSEGCAIALQCISSKRWLLQICDVEGAFLRGDDLSRQTGRVFVEQPPNGIPGVEPGVLVEALKTVYGLADAPLAWYNSFTKALQGLGCRQSRMDSCLYYAYSRHDPHELIGVIALHVDDMCLGGNEEFETRVLAPLKSKYPFKHWHKSKGMFLGKQLEQQSNYDIHVQQTEYAQTIQGVKLSIERKETARRKHQ